MQFTDPVGSSRTNNDMPPAWVVPLSRTLVTSFVVLNLVLIAVRPDLWIREDGISRYLVGDLRWLGVLSFVLLSALARVKARQAMTAQSPTGACAATRAVEPRWRIQAVRGRRLGRRPGSPRCGGCRRVGDGAALSVQAREELTPEEGARLPSPI